MYQVILTFEGAGEASGGQEVNHRVVVLHRDGDDVGEPAPRGRSQEHLGHHGPQSFMLMVVGEDERDLGRARRRNAFHPGDPDDPIQLVVDGGKGESLVAVKVAEVRDLGWGQVGVDAEEAMINGLEAEGLVEGDQAGLIAGSERSDPDRPAVNEDAAFFGSHEGRRHLE